jgi:hypothetical protein
VRIKIANGFGRILTGVHCTLKGSYLALQFVEDSLKNVVRRKCMGIVSISSRTWMKRCFTFLL